MNVPGQCPFCGQPISANAPSGLCPACLLQAGIVDEAPTRHAETRAPAEPAFSGQVHELPPERIARLFPQLDLLRLLGRGGMGTVYLARQKSLDRLVALKIIRPESEGVKDFEERFVREARAMARLSHPNIVGVHDFGTVESTEFDDQSDRESTAPMYFLLMEYVDGTNLRELIADKSLEPNQALAIVPQICEALQFAHDEGIVHRDIKPENILVDRYGRVKIADFGLAKLLQHSDTDLSLTGTHQVMGTPRYMAPEQLEQSKSIDHRADIYSLGVVFYEMLTGELPIGQFEPPSRKVQIDVRLDEVVLRSLAKEPERRYQQASDIKTDVQSVGKGQELTSDVSVTPFVSQHDESPDKTRESIQFAATWVLMVGVAYLVILPVVAGRNAVFNWSPFRQAPVQYPDIISGAFTAMLAAIPGLIMIASAVCMKRLRAYWFVVFGSITMVSFAVAFPVSGNALNWSELEHNLTIGLGLAGLAVGSWTLAALLMQRVRDEFQVTRPASKSSENQTDVGQTIRAPAKALSLIAWLSIPALFVWFLLIGIVLFISGGGSGGGGFEIFISFLLCLLPLVHVVIAVPLVLLGSARMRSLLSRGLAITASVLVMLPFSLTAIAGIPIGIWSLMVLMREDVRTTFERTTVPIERTRAQMRKASVWLLVSGIVSLLFWALYIVGGIITVFGNTPTLAVFLWMVLIIILGFGALCVLAALQIVGARKFQNQSSLRWSWVAIVIGLIPFSPSWLISLPAAVYAIAVMRQRLTGADRTTDLFANPLGKRVAEPNERGKPILPAKPLHATNEPIGDEKRFSLSNAIIIILASIGMLALFFPWLQIQTIYSGDRGRISYWEYAGHEVWHGMLSAAVFFFLVGGLLKNGLRIEQMEIARPLVSIIGSGIVIICIGLVLTGVVPVTMPPDVPDFTVEGVTKGHVESVKALMTPQRVESAMYGTYVAGFAAVTVLLIGICQFMIWARQRHGSPSG